MKIKVQSKGSSSNAKFGFINTETGLPIRKISRHLVHGIAAESEAKRLLVLAGYGVFEDTPVIVQTVISYRTSTAGQIVTGWENACKDSNGESLTVISNTVNGTNGTVTIDGTVASIVGASTTAHLSENLAYIAVPDSVSTIGSHAFCSTSITDVQLPTSLRVIGEKAFSDCQQLVDNITVPEGVTHIGKRAFNGSYYISTINLPSTLVSIGDFAFGSCASLATLTCYAVVPPELGPYIFDDDLVPTIKVPAAGISAYLGDSGWSYYSGRIIVI